MTQLVQFTPPAFGDVLAALDPSGWVNLQPDVDPDDLPPPQSGFFGMFGNRGPLVPFCTWHAGERMAGIQHAGGPKLARRIEIPAGWRVTGDHPKRGLVVAVPAGAGDDEVLAWLVRVGSDLCSVPTSGRWVAELHP